MLASTSAAPITERIRRSDQERTRAALRFYRGLGWNPLPSRRFGRKAPLIPYADYWETVVPAAVLAAHPCVNTQVMTGVRWGLAVVDLDGPMALDVWRSWTLFRDAPATWEVANDLARGRHLYYTIPSGVRSLPSRFVWRLDGAKHAAIEILGDRKLVMAPPSLHSRSGRRYRFLADHGPRDIARPALLPDWVIRLPDIDARPPADRSAPTPKPIRFTPPAKGVYDRKQVLDAIPECDRLGLVTSWGLRLASSGPNAKGWYRCHAIGREDRDASAGFHPGTGYYAEPYKVRLSLFDLAEQIGGYPSWDAACNQLGDRYGVRNTR